MKRIGMMAALLMVFLVTNLAWAGPRHRFFGGNDQLDPAVLETLNLTAEQKEKVAALREGAKKEMTPIKAQFATKRAEMKLLWAQPTIDADKIKGTQKEIQALVGQLRDIQTDMRIAIRKLLTPEQTSELLAAGFNKNYRFKRSGDSGKNRRGVGKQGPRGVPGN